MLGKWQVCFQRAMASVLFAKSREAAHRWLLQGAVCDQDGKLLSPKPVLDAIRSLNMAISDVLHPDGSDFDEFLYAFVGEDRSGSMVTVLSCLTRLGLDPWKEASALAGLSKEVASTRMGSLLAKFGDVPALARESETIARKLVSLLPARAPRRVTLPAGPSQSLERRSVGPVVYIVLFMISIVILARLLVPGA